MADANDETYQTGAERLRALEMSGDPDAVAIARRYRSGPLDSRSAMRQAVRAISASPLRPTYAKATNEDADEAEAKVAGMRAARERERIAREQHLYDLAKAADVRERAMLKLTMLSVALAGVSVVASAAAIVIAA